MQVVAALSYRCSRVVKRLGLHHPEFPAHLKTTLVELRPTTEVELMTVRVEQVSAECSAKVVPIYPVNKCYSGWESWG